MLGFTIVYPSIPESMLENESVTGVILVVTAVVGGSGLFVQLQRNDHLKEAEFILNFNTNFLNFKDFTDVLEYCDVAAGIIKSPKTCKTCKNGNELNYMNVSNYLDYFEPLYFLLENKAIRISRLASLIGHRFFIVVCNPDVQENVIKKHREAYEPLIELYKKLKKHLYKNKDKMPLWVKNHDLIEFLTSNPKT